MDTDSLVQPNRRLMFSETAEELQGELRVPDLPEVSAGYADIYHGVWISPQGHHVEVAIKELKSLIPKDRQTNTEELITRRDIRMKREVFVWSQTKHPNLHPLLGYRSQPQPRLISPWCHHGNLTNYLRKNPGLSRLDKLRLIFQAACGLEHLHAQNPPICHADIKPENVLVNDVFRTALSDFGLSRVLEDLGRPSGLTTSERVKGTLNYMAGELFTAENPRTSLETDVYAFGGLILTVMSGQVPFHDLRESAILFRITNDRPPRKEDHQSLSQSDPLWDLMRRCWNMIPEARPPMQEVLRELLGDICKEEFDRWSRGRLLSVSGNDGAHSSNMDIDALSETPIMLATGPVVDNLHSDFDIAEEPRYVMSEKTFLAARKILETWRVDSKIPRVIRSYIEAAAEIGSTLLELSPTMVRNEGVLPSISPHPRGLSTYTVAIHNSIDTKSTPSTLSLLQSIVATAAKLSTALDQCQAALVAQRPLSNSLETILDLYPQCTRDREELRRPQYDTEARHSTELRKALYHARGSLNGVIARYTYVSTLEYSDELSFTKSQFGVPCSLIFALQLKACMRYLEKKKREKNPLYAREVATALHDDIVNAVERLDPSVACKDVATQCRKLVGAIRTDTIWPQPYLGREADADLLLRMAHHVICTPTRTDVINSSTHSKVSRLRNLIVTFLENDAKQVTPLISQQEVAFSTPYSVAFASPANTISSLSSTLSMTPSSVADWYFGYQALPLDLEVNGVDVGKGGFSTVHKARWMGHDVAVKVIRGTASEYGGVDPSILRKTKQEKRVWSDLYHQYILPFFGVAEWYGQDALVSPWITQNKALKHFEHLSETNRRRRRQLDEAALTEECIDQRLKFVTEAACGILHLHSKGIVHGDIRMGNILVSPDGEPLITDFGLSKPVCSSFDTEPSTAFERSGTVRWMAPELHLDLQPSRTKYSDVWAFACSVLELFSGKSPYSECRDALFYAKISEGEPPEIPARLQQSIPALWQVLRACWAKRPEDRPPMDAILTSLMMIRTGRSWMVDAVRSS